MAEDLEEPESAVYYSNQYGNEVPEAIIDDENLAQDSPNMFDTLCCGLLASLHMVQSSLDELQSVKDELIKHALPPIVMTKMILSISKLFRSVSECHVPATELVRLVGLYSESWEDKSGVLKHMHESYEAKKIQLDIALRKLAVSDAKAQKAEKMRSRMNWERLFLRTIVAKELGDMYDEATAPLKENSLSTERLRELVLNMNNLPATREAIRRQRAEKELARQSASEHTDVEDVQRIDDDEPVTLVEENDKKPAENDQESYEDDFAEQDSRSGLGSLAEKHVGEDHEVDILNLSQAESIRSFRSHPSREERTASRATMLIQSHHVQKCDAQVSTNDPQYDLYLFVRIFAPEGLRNDISCVRCSVSLANQRLNMTPLPVTTVSSSQATPELASYMPVMKSGGRRGLIGSRQSPAVSGGVPSPIAVDYGGSLETSSLRSVKTSSSYDDAVFLITDDIVRRSSALGSQLTFVLYSLPDNQQLGVATIDMDDLHSLDLTTMFIPSAYEDSSSPSPTIGFVIDDSDISSNPSPYQNPVKYAFTDCPTSINQLRDRLDFLRPNSFPVYPPAGDSGATSPLSRGPVKLPVTLSWIKREQPRTVNRDTQYELEPTTSNSGFHASPMSRDAMSRDACPVETVERSVSAMSGIIYNKDEVIPRDEYMKVLRHHEDEMKIMKSEYEARLQDLVEAVQLMHQSHADDVYLRKPSVPLPARAKPTDGRPRSPPLQTSETTPHRRSQHSPNRAKTALEPIEEPPAPQTMTRAERLVRSMPTRDIDTPDTGTVWADDIPRNFYDRLRHFEERVRERRRELNNRSREQVSETIERRLAGQHKLSSSGGTELLSLQDVCLPAVFMPTKTRDLNIYNPRAHQYFHATGSSKLRLTQPPSIMQLPPIPQTNVPVINLFDTCRNYRKPVEPDDVGCRVRSAEWIQRQCATATTSLSQKRSQGKQTTADQQPSLDDKMAFDDVNNDEKVGYVNQAINEGVIVGRS